MKTKKILFFVLIALIVVFAATASACVKAGEKDHDHVYSQQWSFDGKSHWHGCTVDGCVETDGKVPHDFEIIVTKEAACIEKGEKIIRCKTCGYEYTKEIIDGVHRFLAYDKVDPTCTESGKTYYRCRICGEESVQTTQPLGHDLRHVREKKPTCCEPGWKAYEQCRRCDYTTFEAVEPLGHNLMSFPAKEPDCCEPGWKAYDICSRCSYTTYEALQALGHDFVTVDEKAATCTQFGNSEYEHCNRCGLDTEHERFLPTGHELKNHACTKCTKSLYDSNLYGYEFLASMQNGGAMREIYDAIAVAAKNFDRDVTTDVGENAVLVSINFSSLGLDYKQATAVWKTFKDDNPIYYWMSNKALIEGDEIKILIDNAYRTAATRAQCKEMIDEAVEEFASMIHAGASAYDVAMCYHDHIVLAIDYAYDGGKLPEDAFWAHNIIGVLEKKGAVCEGYARTFQLLLNYSDVENLFVTGKLQGANHAWNLVRLDDGQWYWYDLTNDDFGIREYGYRRNYYCMTDENFLKDHEIGLSTNTDVSFLYDLPERADGAYVAEEPTLNSVFEEDGMKFRIVGYNEVTLIRYSGGEEHVVLPESVNYEGRNMKLVALGENDELTGVFENASSPAVRSVYIPSTVRIIWDKSLRANKMENIYVSPDNAIYTDVDGVLYTKDLCTLIKFPSASKATSFVVSDATYYIAADAFENCENLASFTLGKNVMHIGVTNWGFSYPTSEMSFTNLVSGSTGRLINALAGEKEFNIHPENKYYVKQNGGVYNESLTKLYYAFDYVTEFIVPDTLKEIETYSIDDFFEHCTQLEKFVMENGNYAFSVYDGILYGRGNVIYEVPKALKGNVTLREGVSMIGSSMFSDRIYMTGITLPDSLRRIGQSAFKGCTSLQNISIPANVYMIYKQAFEGCTSLRSVSLNDGLGTLERETFKDCGAITEIVIPATVHTIFADVFKGCDSLEKVILAEPSGWSAANNNSAQRRYFGTEEAGDSVIVKDLITGDYADWTWTRGAIR